MTGDTELGIGELARRTGVAVRTIRFYTDEGLLPARRSTGGHRRYDAGALQRLTLIRRLRALGLGLNAIADVAEGRRRLDEAIATEESALDAELATLAWRRAALQALRDADPAEQPARLALLAGAPDGDTAYAALIAFWRKSVRGVAPGVVDMYLEVTAPRPPAEPTPDQVLAYAEMTALTGERSFGRDFLTQGTWAITDRERLHAGIGEAWLLARPRIAAGEPPQPGKALDVFVAAHASARETGDSPAFRQALYAAATAERDPRFHRYWQLTGHVTGEIVPVGTAMTWLVGALGLPSTVETSPKPR